MNGSRQSRGFPSLLACWWAVPSSINRLGQRLSCVVVWFFLFTHTQYRTRLLVVVGCSNGVCVSEQPMAGGGAASTSSSKQQGRMMHTPPFFFRHPRVGLAPTRCRLGFWGPSVACAGASGPFELRGVAGGLPLACWTDPFLAFWQSHWGEGGPSSSSEGRCQPAPPACSRHFGGPDCIVMAVDCLALERLRSLFVCRARLLRISRCCRFLG